MWYRTASVALLLALGAGCSGAGTVQAADVPSADRAVPRLDSILGREVSTRPEGDGGRIVDMLMDSRGQVRAAVVEFGGFLGIGTRKIAVDWNAFGVENGAIVVNVTRNQVRRAKEYKTTDPTDFVQSARD